MCDSEFEIRAVWCSGHVVPLPVSNGGRVVACPEFSVLFLSTSQVLG